METKYDEKLKRKEEKKNEWMKLQSTKELAHGKRNFSRFLFTHSSQLYRC